VPLVFAIVVTAMFVAGFKEEETSPRKAAAVAFD
jgi:hypothetical protein